MVRVLIADDHDVVRCGLKNFLASHGFEVCGEATSGEQAIAGAEASRPDIAILDALMPGIDGLAATRRIRELSPNTEVLLFTMHDTEELVADALAAGARGYVLKSDPSRHLLSAIEALAHHGSFLTPSLSDSLVGAVGTNKNRAAGARSPLTVREREVVRLLAVGRGNKEVGAALGISVKTVESHRAHIMRKLELGTLVDLVRYAVRNHLVPA
jgi:DNA-binding NarL/FixJ family response regulator